jgi:hypothetical protein
LSLLFFTVTSQAADGLINDVSFHTNSGASESVVFHLNGPYLPKAFAIKGENPRVVFDFMGTQLSSQVPSAIVAGGIMVKKIRMGRYSDKTRVVLDLASGGEFNFDQDFDERNSTLTIVLYSTEYPPKYDEPVAEVAKVKEVAATVESKETIEVAEVVAPVEVAAESSPALAALLSDVSFKGTSNKGEMVLFKLNGFFPPEVSGEEKGEPKVTCTFNDAALGSEVLALQQTDGEFVKKISVLKADDSNPLRVIIDLVPNKNYDLQQVFFKEDNLFVIIVNSYDAMMAVPDKN